MNEAKVSVIIPTYNRCSYIVESLESVLNQTIKPYEIIVVNDGSTDDTAKVLEPYFSRINYLYKENGGKSTALNKALKYVTGDFVWIFDDDDIALFDALENHLNIFDKNSDADFTYSPLIESILENGSLKPLYQTKIPQEAYNQLFISFFDHCFVTHPAILVKTDCYKKIGAFNEDLIRSQDYEMLLRLAYNFNGYAVEKPTFLRRQHSGDRGNSEQLHKASEVSKNWAFYDQIFSKKYYETLSLSEYLPKEKQTKYLELNEMRLALLTRASIMARKGLWNLVINDINLIFDNCNIDHKLTTQECNLCIKIMSYNNIHAYLPFIGNIEYPIKISEKLNGNLGNDIRLNFAKGLLYQLITECKDKEIRLAVIILRSMLIILGAKGFVFYIKSLIKK